MCDEFSYSESYILQKNMLKYEIKIYKILKAIGDVNVKAAHSRIKQNTQ